WMAKRQQLIPTDALPTPQERLALFETARKLFLWDNYDEIGIDHFAAKTDGLSIAQRNGTLRRNFQGYTDDTANVLLAVGASSIARFPQGYAQNAPATSAHTGAIREGRFSTSRGHTFSGEDLVRSRLIEALMCDFRIDRREIMSRFDVSEAWLNGLFSKVATQFPDMIAIDAGGLSIPEHARPLTRMIARAFDAYDMSKAQHSAAI
ncbi:MAG: coproporphyrinogen III oxidase, partial [Shimia sp.]|nr:coproporphyrinogen III oxidase [Shimia sp.]